VSRRSHFKFMEVTKDAVLYLSKTLEDIKPTSALQVKSEIKLLWALLVHFVKVRKTSVLSLCAVSLWCLSWALASPIGASSDDDYHLASIWCSLGERPGFCEGKNSESALVPGPIANAGNCYLGDNEKSARCTNLELSEFSESLVETSRLALNTNTSLFYRLNGLLVTENIELSIITMRLLNGFLFMTLLVVAWMSGSSVNFRRLQLVVICTLVPSFAFILNSNNSSSWIFLGSLFCWYFIFELWHSTERRRRRFAAVGLVVSFLLGVGSRSEAWIFLGLQIAVVSIHAVVLRGIRPKRQTLIIATAVGVPLSLTVLVFIKPWELLTSGFAGVHDDTPLTRDWFWVFIHNVQSVSNLYIGLIGGIRGVGASDTEPYGIVQTVLTAVNGFVILSTLRRSSISGKILIFALVFISILIPLIILQANGLLVGEELLPRYLYPLLVIVVAFCALQDKRLSMVSRNQLVAIVVLVSVVHSIVLRQVILRHTYGIEAYGIVNLDIAPEWWWTTQNLLSPLTVWVLGSVSLPMAFLLSRSADGSSLLPTETSSSN
jgi:hypothetical protein